MGHITGMIRAHLLPIVALVGGEDYPSFTCKEQRLRQSGPLLTETFTNLLSFHRDPICFH